MKPAWHSAVELDALRKLTVPTLANALETFGIAPTSGFCNSTIKCHFPELPLMVGYAVTARVSTDQPPSKVRPPVHEPDYSRFLFAQPGPMRAAVPDLDAAP